MKKTILLLILLACVSYSGLAQPIPETTSSHDTTKVSLYKIHHPTFQPWEFKAPDNPYPQPKRINGFVKTLMKIGTDIVRGDGEENSIYGFNKSWTYPGTTVKYPETSTELELFLKRYNTYNIGGD